jgi:hypothetical protein
MERFEWGERNFGVRSPHDLQQRGINVYFAPEVARERKLVNLADGRVDQVFAEQDPPREGYYADFEALEEYCRQTGRPLAETDGTVSLQPSTTTEAGDPLRHEGDHHRQ